MATVLLDHWFFHSFVPVSRRSSRSLKKEIRYRRYALVRLGRAHLRLRRVFNTCSEEARSERLRAAALIATLGNQELLQLARREQLERELKLRSPAD